MHNKGTAHENWTERVNRTSHNNSNKPMFVSVCLFLKGICWIITNISYRLMKKEKCTGCGTNLSFVRLVLKEISFIFFTATWLYQKTTAHNFGIISRTFSNTAQKKALRETSTFHIIRESQSWNGGTSLCTEQQKSYLFLVLHNSNKKTVGSLMKIPWWQI